MVVGNEQVSKDRAVAGVYRGDGFHWVGDGFHVTNVFPSGNDLGARLSPFLLMDYHAPYDYSPTDSPRGVGAHPHRGFETVTLAFEGVLAHHDSTGGGGVISAGDVQWMTAAGGILHKEYHEANWAKKGGTMHMMQLWVNLPAAHKMDPPGYQAIRSDDMGHVDLGGGGFVTVIAGEFEGVRGPARTFSPINLWDVTLRPPDRMKVAFPASQNAAVFVLEGNIVTNGAGAEQHELVLFENEGDEITIRAGAGPEGARLLVLNGAPIDEPIASYGPFVMNTRAELIEAVDDFNNGLFGQLV